MKVLITTDWYIPAINGVVSSVLNLRRELQAMGHEVRVLTLSQSDYSYESDGVIYLGSVSAGRIYPGARVRVGAAGRYLRQLQSWGPDIIHSQCEFSTFGLAKTLARRLGVPLVHTYHTVYENYTHYFSPSKRWGRRAVRHFTCAVAGQVDCMIAPTGKVEALLRSYDVRCPIAVAPSGIDLRPFEAPAEEEKLAALRRQLGLDPEGLVLVSVGRLAQEKNHGELLEALAALPYADRRVQLVFVGDGPDRRQLERKANLLGLGGRVKFAGMAPPSQIALYYKLGDVFVSASQSETQGLTYAEALASGLPAVCRKDACLAGVVRNGVNGWQYETQAQFIQCVHTLAIDPSLRCRMAQAARQSAWQFSSRTFARRVLAVYEQQLRPATRSIFLPRPQPAEEAQQ